MNTDYLKILEEQNKHYISRRKTLMILGYKYDRFLDGYVKKGILKIADFKYKGRKVFDLETVMELKRKIKENEREKRKEKKIKDKEIRLSRPRLRKRKIKIKKDKVTDRIKKLGYVPLSEWCYRNKETYKTVYLWLRLRLIRCVRYKNRYYVHNNETLEFCRQMRLKNKRPNKVE